VISLVYQSNLWISLASIALFSVDRKVALTETGSSKASDRERGRQARGNDEDEDEDNEDDRHAETTRTTGTRK
jgi:hypothetical protein